MDDGPGSMDEAPPAPPRRGAKRGPPTRFEQLDPFELGRLSGMHHISAEGRDELLQKLRERVGDGEAEAAAYARAYSLRYRLALLGWAGLAAALAVAAALLGAPSTASALLLGGLVVARVRVPPMALASRFGIGRSLRLLRAGGAACAALGLVLLLAHVAGW